jgi:hypothetical protein
MHTLLVRRYVLSILLIHIKSRGLVKKRKFISGFVALQENMISFYRIDFENSKLPVLISLGKKW